MTGMVKSYILMTPPELIILILYTNVHLSVSAHWDKRVRNTEFDLFLRP